MKVLIGIISCRRDQLAGLHKDLRNTWVNTLLSEETSQYAYKFFVGRGDVITQADEILLDCPDDYRSLPWKTHAMFTWALSQGYGHILKVDVDNYINVKAMLASDFRSYDYVGNFNGELGNPNATYGSLYAWTKGGVYWLSAKATQHIIDQPAGHKSICPRLKIPCEDLGVGQILGPLIQQHKLTALHDTRYAAGYNDDYSCEFSSHFCSTGGGKAYDPAWMHKHHEANKCS